jgi:hypothetical protein
MAETPTGPREPHRRSDDDPTTYPGVVWRIVSHPGPMIGAIIMIGSLSVMNALACPHGPLHWLMPAGWQAASDQVEGEAQAAGDPKQSAP